jgi:LPS sulfotransferase NodH
MGPRPGPVEAALTSIGKHEAEIRAALGHAPHAGGPVFDRPLVLVAFKNRSGSNLLVERLEQTGRFASFGEAFTSPVVLAAARAGGAAGLPDYLRGLPRDPGDPRIDLFKASMSQMLMLYRAGVMRMYPATYVLHIMRGDLVGQAVSFGIAQQTKRWTRKGDGAGQVDARYDGGAVSRFLDGAANATGIMPVAAAVIGARYMPVFYEDLTRDPDATVAACMAFLGLPAPEGPLPQARLKRQATALNAAFRERWLAEMRAKATR